MEEKEYSARPHSPLCFYVTWHLLTLLLALLVPPSYAACAQKAPLSFVTRAVVRSLPFVHYGESWASSVIHFYCFTASSWSPVRLKCVWVTDKLDSEVGRVFLWAGMLTESNTLYYLWRTLWEPPIIVGIFPVACSGLTVELLYLWSSRTSLLSCPHAQRVKAQVCSAPGPPSLRRSAQDCWNMILSWEPSGTQTLVRSLLVFFLPPEAQAWHLPSWKGHPAASHVLLYCDSWGKPSALSF